MELELLQNEIKKRIEFLEKRYDVYAWKISDSDLTSFLEITYEAFFKGNSSSFFICIIEYFDYLFNELMSDNRAVATNEYLLNHVYYLQVIFNKYDIRDDAYKIIDSLKDVYGINEKSKVLTLAV